MAMSITVTEDGPYVVRGGVPLLRAEIAVNEDGEPYGWRETGRIDVPDTYTLCRCGASHEMPFCDYSHIAIGFDGTECAGHRTYTSMALEIGSEDLAVHDARQLCADARFCTRAGGLWHLVERCDEPGVRELAIEEAELCPSGRYVASREDGSDYEPDLEPSIVLIEDPQLGVSGPIFVRGGIEIIDAYKTSYEVRNRVTLCRCGKSRNKPFCDGAHIKAGFREFQRSEDELVTATHRS